MKKITLTRKNNKDAEIMSILKMFCNYGFLKLEEFKFYLDEFFNNNDLNFEVKESKELDLLLEYLNFSKVKFAITHNR